MAQRRRAHGEGGVYQLPNGRWRALLDAGWRDGRRRRLSSVHDTKRAATTWLRQVQRDREQGRLVEETASLAEWFDTYLREVARPNVRDSTYQNYERDFRRHIAPDLGRLQLTEITPAHLTRLYAAKRAEGLSASSVRSIHATIRRALNIAMRWGLVGRNVALLVDPPPLSEHEVNPLSPEEARRFLEAARGDRLEARWVVAISLGLRQGEVLGLWWEDIDFDRDVLRLRRQLARVRLGGSSAFAPLKTRRSRRTLPLPPSLVETLRRHRDAQEAERANAKVWHDERIVFASPIGTPIDPSNDNRAFKALLARAGLRRIRLHDLRHTAASLLLAQGVHPRVVMEILGHSQISLTMNTYSHVLPSVLGEAATSMERTLWGGGDGTR